MAEIYSVRFGRVDELAPELFDMVFFRERLCRKGRLAGNYWDCKGVDEGCMVWMMLWCIS